MDPAIIGGILSVGSKLIDKLFTSPEDKARAKLELMRLEQEGNLKEIEVQLSAIMAEANSKDPWTSRARPSFLYVVYLLLLWSIPMGILTIFNPQAATDFTAGFKAWLDAIPQEIITLFGTVMLGYIGGRSWEKVRGAAK